MKILIKKKTKIMLFIKNVLGSPKSEDAMFVKNYVMSHSMRLSLFN